MKKSVFLYKIVVFMTTFLFISFSTSALHEKYNTNSVSLILNTTQITDAPLWEVGNYWMYSIQIDGTQGDILSFDLNIENFKMEVTSDQEDIYEVTISVPRGYVDGSGNVNLDILQLSGSLKDTKLDGFFEIKKSTLEIIYGEFIIDGYIDKVVDIPFEIEANLTFYNENFNQSNFSMITFPLTIDNQWKNPFTYIVIPLKINLIPDTSYLYTFVDRQEVICEGWDVIQTQSVEYDALHIAGDIAEKHDLWYSIAAGNIIKVMYEDFALGNEYAINSMDMILQSTNFKVPSNPPEVPSRPSGATSLVVGQIAEYETFASDPDNDLIKYIFDWGDETTESSSFYESGETGVISKEWVQKGVFSVKVKARDIYGEESDWSEALLVTIENNAPETPTKPEGPTEGKVDSSYSYITLTTDVDGHTVRYGWDWDGDQNEDEWTDFYKPGQQVSSAHTWSDEGNYQIRVRAEDAFGEKSDWSEPLSVTMPKNKVNIIYQLINQWINKMMERYHNQIILELLDS